MSKRRTREMRVLAIDPISRGFGFAVLDGPRLLIDWGVVHIKTEKLKRSLARIDDLVENYGPDVIVTEDVRLNPRRSAWVRKLLAELQDLVRRKRLRLRSVSAKHVRQAFFESGRATKHQIATAVAQRFPELGIHLPPPRKPWQSEPEIMAVFDAVTFTQALVA